MKKQLAISLIILGCAIIIFTIYRNTETTREQTTYSPYSYVRGAWARYVESFITADGRVFDGEVTTSEGQSYAMLRAVWIDDRDTFEKVWLWTKQNLRRPDDQLFSWRYRVNAEGVGKIDDANSASDANVDIALALIFASNRFNNPTYLEEAKLILNDIWELETGVDNQENYYLTAGNWARGKEELVLNPSYFAPYAFRIFAQVDPQHPWTKLVDSSYLVLNKWQETHQLPPDWVTVNRSNGDLIAPRQSGLTTNYSYDALRIPWRIAIDYRWNQESRAKDYLTKLNANFETIFTVYQKLVETYSSDTTPLSDNESPALYATTAIGMRTLEHPLGSQLMEQKITPLYSNDTKGFKNDITYYAQNILWFAVATEEGYVQNLYAQ